MNKKNNEDFARKSTAKQRKIKILICVKSRIAASQIFIISAVFSTLRHPNYDPRPPTSYYQLHLYKHTYL